MDINNIFGIIITVIMGFGWGSFATMATYRIPRGMPWVGDKPRCFMCKHELNLIDYFSVFSYFIWRGKCRYCKGEYECSFSYFITEFAITAFFLLCYFQYGFSDLFVLLTLMVVALTILAVVDSEHKKIPSKILISTMMIGLVYRTFIDQTFYGALYCGISAAVIALAIRHIYFLAIGQGEIAKDYTKWQHEDRFKGPGFDYVKLLAICGIYLPISHLFLFSALNVVIILLWKLLHRTSLRIGAIMAFNLALFVIYPEVVDKLLRFF